MYYRTMTRTRGSKADGGTWTEAEIEAVWRKGQLAPGYSPQYVRRDTCGALIARSEHGDTKSVTGWEIDHIRPVVSGGSDDISNLQPLQWENNRAKGDGPQVCVRR